eukprot:1013362-Alexandrium_andersonii.AAC.1
MCIRDSLCALAACTSRLAVRAPLLGDRLAEALPEQGRVRRGVLVRPPRARAGRSGPAARSCKRRSGCA